MGGGPGVKTPSLSLQPVRGRRRQRQHELKCSQPNSWQEAGLFCSLCEVRTKAEAGREEAKKGGFLLGPPSSELLTGPLLFSPTSNFGIFLLKLERRIQNTEEAGFSLCSRSFYLSTLLLSLSTAAGRRTETMGLRATKGREKRLGCLAFGDL